MKIKFSWPSLLFVSLLTLAPPISTAMCNEDPDLSQFVEKTYGEMIEFAVVRNGKVVGTHRTRFARSETGLQVHSAMQLTVHLLFIPVFDFSYESNATWCGPNLVRLDAKVDDNGTDSAVKAYFDGAATTVESGPSTTTHPQALMPTNHWNPGVLDQRQVLNTITGQINAVELKQCNAERAVRLGLSLPPGTQCFEYRGDLQATVWYLDKRWIGLAFKGEDGSDIVYRCRRCKML